MRVLPLLLATLVLAAPALADDFDAWSGGPETAAPKPAYDPWAQADVNKGERMFRVLCADCHGREGKGDGPTATSMTPKPRDLSRGEFRFRSTASGALPLRDDLLRTLAEGLPGTEMPSWKQQLTDKQIRSLVLFIETLSARFQTEERRSQDVLVDAEALVPPAPDAALLARGKELYGTMQCGECHGPLGRGDGKAVGKGGRIEGSESRVFDFTKGLYKGGNRAQDLYRTFMTGLDGSPMPSYADSLPEEADRWALAFYVLSLTRPRGPAFYLTERPRWDEPSQRKVPDVGSGGP